MWALRIVRLFGRVQPEELTKMFSAITASIFPIMIMNAFVILVIVLSICSCPAGGCSSNTEVSPNRPLQLRDLSHRPRRQCLQCLALSAHRSDSDAFFPKIDDFNLRRARIAHPPLLPEQMR